MDDQLLAELYGIDPNEEYETDDSMIKEAQAELVEAVADEAGIDLNEMDDDELEKFASYVLSADSHEEDYIEDDMYAQADQMGRVMAHAYADEQMKIASLMEEEAMIDDVYGDIADSWEMAKIAKITGEFTSMGNKDFGDLSNYEKNLIANRRFGKTGKDKNTLSDVGVRKRDYLRALVGRGTGYYDIQSARGIGKALRAERAEMTAAQLKDEAKALRSANVKNFLKNLSKKERADILAYEMTRGRTTRPLPNLSGLSRFEQDAVGRHLAGKARKGLMIRGGLKAGATAAGLGALGYGAYRTSKR